MSFSQSLREVGRRWWIVLLAVVVVALLAAALPVRRLSSASATARMHEQDTTVAFSYKGDPQPETATQSAHDLVRSNFVDPDVAQTVAKRIGAGLTGPQIVSALGFTALTGTDVQLTYSAGSQDNAQRRLSAYVEALVAARRAQTRRTLLAAAGALQARGGAVDAVKRLQTAAASVNNQIYQVGGVSVSPPTQLRKSLLLLGGAIAGLILGIAIALGLARADRRVRRLSDLRAAGIRAVPIDTKAAASIDRVRVLAEVSGIGPEGGVVAICAAHGSADSVATGLTSAFLAAGRPVTLVTPTSVRRAGGDGQGDAAVSASPLRSLRDATTALDGRRPNEVVVIAGPGLLDDAQALVASRIATVTVLILQRGRTRWDDLGEALDILEHQVSSESVVVCLDSSRSAMGVASAAARVRGERQPRFAD